MCSLLIHFQNNTIFIKGSETLRPNQLSQISFWGFQKGCEKGVYEFCGPDPSMTLKKIMAYFSKVKVDCSLTENCRNELARIDKAEQLFENRRIQGRKYKNGAFDRRLFWKFYRSIEQFVHRELKEHQIKSAYHLYLVQNGANFSVPGSGKTAAVLAVYEKLRREGKVNLLFVVGPPACFGPWRTEFDLTLGRMPTWKILAGGHHLVRKSEYYALHPDRSELYLTTFQTLLNDSDELGTFLREADTKAFMVIDEAHYIKQLNGSWANAVLDVAEYAEFRCVLTGTPIPRSYSDIFNLFDFLWPSHESIDSATKVKIQHQEGPRASQDAIDLLEESIGGLFYRVRKSELGLIPPVFHPPVLLEMNKHERLLYDAIQNKIRSYSDEDYLRNIDLVRKLQRGRMIRLRQCVSYAKLLQSAVQDYDEDLLENDSRLLKIICDYDNMETPSKLLYLKKLVKEMHSRNRKIVIWAHFIATLKLIREHLTNAGFRCKLIYGDTPIERTSVVKEETREKIRDEFIDPESGLDILIANPAACAESISLHKTCHNAVYYDLSYNCAQYLQSLDRIHRVGGSEVDQANYFFLQYKDTLESDIRSNLQAKADRMYNLIEEDYSIYSLDMFEEEGEVEAYERLFGES